MSKNETETQTETKTLTFNTEDETLTESPLRILDAGAGALFGKAIVNPSKAHDKQLAPVKGTEHDYTITNERTGESMRITGTTNISEPFSQVQWSLFSPKQIAEALLASVGEMLDGNMKQAMLRRTIQTLNGDLELSEERKAQVKDDMGELGREAEITKPCRQDAGKIQITRGEA